MGYTHYWTKNAAIPAEAWNKIMKRAERIIEASPVPIAADSEIPDEKPICNAERILLNGVGEDGHETFLLTPNGPKEGVPHYMPEGGFSFCKTARKPYDIVVVAILFVVNKYAEKFVDVSSDGAAKDWDHGRALAENALKPELFAIPQALIEKQRT